MKRIFVWTRTAHTNGKQQPQHIIQMHFISKLPSILYTNWSRKLNFTYNTKPYNINTYTGNASTWISIAHKTPPIFNANQRRNGETCSAHKPTYSIPMIIAHGPWPFHIYVSPLDSSSSLVHFEFFSCMQNIRLVTSKLSYRTIFVVLVSRCFTLFYVAIVKTDIEFELFLCWISDTSVNFCESILILWWISFLKKE